MIIDQQIELYFGDDYPRMLKNAQTFVGVQFDYLLSWGASKNEVLTNEGGRAGLLRKALCHIIEEGDEGKGLRAYGSSLAEAYTIAYAHRRNRVNIEDVPPLILSDDGGIHKAFLALESEREDLTSSFDTTSDIAERGVPSRYGLDQEEYDLLTVLGNTHGSQVAAAELLGWEPKIVRKVYARLWSRYRGTDKRKVVNPMSHSQRGRMGGHTKNHVNKGQVNPTCDLCAS